MEYLVNLCCWSIYSKRSHEQSSRQRHPLTEGQSRYSHAYTSSEHKIAAFEKKMPKIDTLDALEEQEEHEDDYQTNSNW